MSMYHEETLFNKMNKSIAKLQAENALLKSSQRKLKQKLAKAEQLIDFLTQSKDPRDNT